MSWMFCRELHLERANEDIIWKTFLHRVPLGLMRYLLAKTADKNFSRQIWRRKSLHSTTFDAEISWKLSSESTFLFVGSICPQTKLETRNHFMLCWTAVDDKLSISAATEWTSPRARMERTRLDIKLLSDNLAPEWVRAGGARRCDIIFRIDRKCFNQHLLNILVDNVFLPHVQILAPSSG